MLGLYLPAPICAAWRPQNVHWKQRNVVSSWWQRCQVVVMEVISVPAQLPLHLQKWLLRVRRHVTKANLLNVRNLLSRVLLASQKPIFQETTNPFGKIYSTLNTEYYCHHIPTIFFLIYADLKISKHHLPFHYHAGEAEATNDVSSALPPPADGHATVAWWTYLAMMTKGCYGTLPQLDPKCSNNIYLFEPRNFN